MEDIKKMAEELVVYAYYLGRADQAYDMEKEGETDELCYQNQEMIVAGYAHDTVTTAVEIALTILRESGVK